MSRGIESNGFEMCSEDDSAVIVMIAALGLAVKQAFGGLGELDAEAALIDGP